MKQKSLIVSVCLLVLIVFMILSDNVLAFQTQMPMNFQQNNLGWRFMSHADYSNPSCDTYYVYHPGIDLNNVDDRNGQIPVHAIADGKIVLNKNSWLGIVIKHTDDNGNIYYSQYGHIDHLENESDLQVGMTVTRGQHIGNVGAVGADDVYHLHFTIRSPNDHNINNPEVEDTWWGTCGANIDSRKKVFTRYEAPLSFIRSRLDPNSRTIIVDDSVTYPNIGNDIDANNRVLNSSGNVIRECFFEAFNLNEWNTYVPGTGENKGFEGNYHYASTTNGNETAAGKWYFNIFQAGNYEVFANIPVGHGTSRQASYEINHESISNYVTIDQYAINGDLTDRWVSLGTYYFEIGNLHYVRLTNNTGETGSRYGETGSRYVAFDAIMLKYIPDPSPQSTTLTNGLGDGSATITIDPYGTFGTATAAGAAMYDPIGSYGSASTVYQSSLYIGMLDSGNSAGGLFLYNADDGQYFPGDSVSGGKFISITSKEAKSTFSVNGLDCELTQTLNDKGPQGSTLTQTYKFINTTDGNQSFDLIRHVDGDLYFEGSFSNDYGGASSDGETLFEFDSGDDPTNPSTFVGITNQGGDDVGFHIDCRIAPYQFTDDIIALGAAVLDGSIAGDTNGDRIIDDPYDVTLTLGNRFLTIIPDQMVTFTTKTIFGAGSPIARAALPTGVVPVQEYNNTINPGETHWYDFINEAVQDIWVVLGFGSEFNLRVHQPDGTLFQEEQTETSPIEMFIPNAQTGQWQIEVSAIQTPIPNDPYVLAIGVRDADEDGISDAQDNCPNIPNPQQSDSDDDGIGNICDNCLNIPNPDQSDSDGDGIADVCDNCPNTPNSDQTDSNGDGIGDACEVEEVPGDLDGDGDVDRDDVNIIKVNRNQPAIVCPECDIDGDGTITVLDARKLMMMCTCPRCICP